jgi:hypothetical protein
VAAKWAGAWTHLRTQSGLWCSRVASTLLPYTGARGADADGAWSEARRDITGARPAEMSSLSSKAGSERPGL